MWDRLALKTDFWQTIDGLLTYFLWTLFILNLDFSRTVFKHLTCYTLYDGDSVVLKLNIFIELWTSNRVTMVRGFFYAIFYSHSILPFNSWKGVDFGRLLFACREGHIKIRWWHWTAVYRREKEQFCISSWNQKLVEIALQFFHFYFWKGELSLP